MKKFFKYLILIIVLGTASAVAYIYFSDSKNRDPFTVIPKDAIYIIETDNLTEGWNTLRESTIWLNLITNPYFEDINESALSLDSLIHDDKVIDNMMSDRRLLISAHMIGKDDFDFIFAIDMKQASKVSFVKDYIESILNVYDYSMDKTSYKEAEIMILTDMTLGDKLYVSFIDNILVCSYVEELIHKSIDVSTTDDGWDDDVAFTELKSELGSKSLFRFYLNYSVFDDYIAYYMDKTDENLYAISRILRHTTFNINFESERFSMNGYTSLKDTTSYFHAMLGVEPGERSAYNILSDQTAIYISLCFEDYMEFYEQVSSQFTAEDTTQAENYQKNMQRIEKLFKIDIEEDFFSWIGSEIAYAKMRPNANSTEKDVLAVIHTNDIDLAKEKLSYITKQIKKRSPVRFKTKEYKSYEINYLAMKGFFKLFFGKLFKKLDKPYFTYIEDYVVFSNNPSQLMDVIDDYEAGNILANSEQYMNFNAELNEKSNVTVFVNTPKLYSQMYYFGNEKQRKNIKENKELIVSFARIGFQMTSNGEFFETNLLADHDINALYDDDMEQFQAAAEDVFLSEIDSMKFKIEFSKREMSEDGPFIVYFEDLLEQGDSVIQHKGRIDDGKINGVCRTYYESGNLFVVADYEDNKLDGQAMFYYDNEEQNLLAFVFFKENKMDDVYKEFFKNGNPKALIEFKKGLPHGDVEFYYERGSLKISGKYKKGQKTGKWKFFTETGEPYKKTKYKEGKICQ